MNKKRDEDKADKTNRVYRKVADRIIGVLTNPIPEVYDMSRKPLLVSC